MYNLISRFKNSTLKYTLALISFMGSLVVKLMTIAPTVSFWDCGEYISASYILGVPHPPGAPLYLLIGRFFSMLPIGQNIAFRVNLISPIVTSLAILFLYLIIVKYLKRYLDMSIKINRVAVYFGAFIGAMTFAFTDSHWFNSVEAEVYGFSTFLTSLVMWLGLRWEERTDQSGHERYILLIAYVLGLAIGVHLLSLLVIFVIALIIYFRYYSVSSNWWLVGDLLLGLGMTGGLFYVIYSVIPAPDHKLKLIGVITLAGIFGIYYLINKYSSAARISEHCKNVNMGLITSTGFLIIYVGIIRGVPQIIETGGLLLLSLITLGVVGVTVWSVLQNKNLLSILLMSVILILVGYSTYVSIPVRSVKDPAIDMNNPETVERVKYYLEREQYGKKSILDIFNRKVWTSQKAKKYKDKGAWNYFWNYQIKKMYLRYFNWQFVGRAAKKVDPLQFFFPFPLLIGFFGALSHFDYDRKHAFTILALFLFTGLMIVLYLNQKAPQPRERDYSYTGSFFAFSIWIGIGASEIIRRVSELGRNKLRSILQYGIIGLLIVLLPLNLLQANYHTHDRSGNYLAWDYAYNFLTSCKANAILFTNGDNDTYPLWYLQNVEGIREDVQVVNLSLLNSSWYIKHIRDSNPRIKIGLSDNKIDSLHPVSWNGRKVSVKAPKNSDQSKMSWAIPPALGNRGIRIQDLVLWKIIQMNIRERPIYLSVTTPVKNRIGLDKTGYLSLEGMAYRITPNNSPRINLEKTRKQLLEKNQYRNLDNSEVFYQSYSKRYIRNYRMLCLRLAQKYHNSGQYRKAAQVFSELEKKIPRDILSINSADLSLRYSLLYNSSIKKLAQTSENDIGNLIQSYTGAEKIKYSIAKIIRSKADNLNDKLRYLSILVYDIKAPGKAIELLEEMRKKYRDNAKIISLLVTVYERSEQYKNAQQLLENWVEKHPNDNQAEKRLQEVKSKVENK